MTAPMTPARIAQIRAATAQTKAAALSGAWMSEGYLDREDLLAEIDRLRALPVLLTCDPCRHLDCTGDGEWFCNHDEVAPQDSDPRVRREDAPPSWCPLRGGER